MSTAKITVHWKNGRIVDYLVYRWRPDSLARCLVLEIEHPPEPEFMMAIPLDNMSYYTVQKVQDSDAQS